MTRRLWEQPPGARIYVFAGQQVTVHAVTSDGTTGLDRRLLSSRSEALLEPTYPAGQENADVVTDDLIIVNTLGMHARPAAKLVETVLPFPCDVTIEKNGQKVNAKSIMGLLTLAAAQGTMLRVTCAGDQAEQALEAIRALIESGFGEA